MKVISREFGQSIEILKFNDFKGEACMVSDAGIVKDENGKKIVKAGTPHPTNDEGCKGILLHDVDVTYGETPGTRIFEGSIDNKKLAKNGITVGEAAKKVLPRVTFFE